MPKLMLVVLDLALVPLPAVLLLTLQVLFSGSVSFLLSHARVLPAITVEKEVAHKELVRVPVPELTFERKLRLVHRREGTLSHAGEALLALVGAVNVPIIHFSVKWWNTLHQGASVSMTAAPKMASIMLTAMLILAIAFWFYTIAVVLTRVRAIILERERENQWVAEQSVVGQPGHAGWQAGSGGHA